MFDRRRHRRLWSRSMAIGRKGALRAIAAFLAAMFAFVVVAHTTAHRFAPASGHVAWSAEIAPAADGSDGPLGCVLCQNAIAQARVAVFLTPAGVCFDSVLPLISAPRLPSERGAPSSRGP